MIPYLRSKIDQLEKEKRKMGEEIQILKADRKSKQDWDSLVQENAALKRQIQELKANAPFQQNDTTAERDQVARLQSRIQDLEAQLAGKVDTFQQLQLPSQSAQAPPPKVSLALPNLTSPKKISEGGARSGSGPVESPPIPGVNMDIPDAASSGAPPIDLDAEEEPTSKGRKRRASSVIPLGAESASKRRRINGADLANDLEDRNMEQMHLSSKLQWHLGPAHRLLELSDDAYMRLNRTFIAQQEQFSSIEPIQTPDCLEVSCQNLPLQLMC
jgi:hypothetical protein